MVCQSLTGLRMRAVAINDAPQRFLDEFRQRAAFRTSLGLGGVENGDFRTGPSEVKPSHVLRCYVRVFQGLAQ